MAAPGQERFTWRKSPEHPDGQHEVLLKVKQTRQQCKLSCEGLPCHKHKLLSRENSLILYFKITQSRFYSMALIHDDSSISMDNARHEQLGSKETYKSEM